LLAHGTGEQDIFLRIHFCESKNTFKHIWGQIKLHRTIFGPPFRIYYSVLYSIHYFVKIIYIVSQARKLQEEVGLTVNHLLRYDHFGTHNNEFFVLPCFFVNNIFENLM
jgi:hypothetical protein